VLYLFWTVGIRQNQCVFQFPFTFCRHKKEQKCSPRHVPMPQNILKCIFVRGLSRPWPRWRKSAPPHPWFEGGEGKGAGRKGEGGEEERRGKAGGGEEKRGEGRERRGRGKGWPPPKRQAWIRHWTTQLHCLKFIRVRHVPLVPHSSLFLVLFYIFCSFHLVD